MIRMICKRILVVASVSVNAFVFVIPGGIVFGIWVYDAVNSDGGGERFLPDFVAVIGLIMIAVGTCNIACLYFAHRWGGWRRRVVLTLGYTLSVGAVAYGVMIAVDEGDPYGALIVGAVGSIIPAALLFAPKMPRPEGICQHCDYDLTGLERTKAGGWNGVCPECGADTGQEEKSPA